MEKDKKNIDDILRSVEGMRRAAPPPFLYTRIMQRIGSGERTGFVPGRKLWLAAASFLILVAVNIAGYAYYSKRMETRQSGLAPMLREYQLIERSF